MRIPKLPRYSVHVRLIAMSVAAAFMLIAARPDAEIEKDIRARLSKSKISADGFAVRVHNGTATLTGKTDVIQHKGVATRMAKSGGATKVDNRIEISAGARNKAASHLAHAREMVRSEPKAKPPLRGEAPEAVSAAAAPASPVPPPVRRAVVKH